MAHEHLLRPARLYQKFPEARRCVRDLVASDQAYVASDVATLQLCIDRLASAFNERVASIPDFEARKPFSPSGLRNIINEMSWLARVEASGRQHFLIADDVKKELLNSDLGQIRVSDIRLPFEAFYVALEVSLDFGSFAFEGAYVAMSPQGPMVSMAFQEADASAPDWFLTRTYTVVMDERDALLAEVIATKAVEEVDNARKLAADISDAIGSFPGTVVAKSVEGFGRDFAEREVELTAALTLVGNVLCLLAAMPEDMIRDVEFVPPRSPQTSVSTKAARKVRGAALKAGSLEVRRLTFLRSDQHAGNGEGSDRIGPRAHWRRGHWRRQQVGPASQRTFKPVWIRPTLVNPDRGGAAEESIYDVKSSGRD